MAIRSRSSNTSMFSLKVSLISIGVLSVGVIISRYLPVIVACIVSEAPVLWSSLRLWLTPPYLYFVINCIIITIAATSRFQYKVEEQTDVAVQPVKIPADLVQEFPVPAVYVEDSVLLKTPVVDAPMEFVKDSVAFVEEFDVAEKVVFDYGVDIPAVATPVFEVAEVEMYTQPEAPVSEVKNSVDTLEEEERDYEIVIQKNLTEENPTDSAEILRSDSAEILRTDSMEFPTEYSYRKPPVSARFGHHRRIARGNPEAGKALKVSKPKRNDTLEATWKMITEGRSIPLARHLKKSDTWETHNRNVDLQEPSASVKKADTFNDRNTNSHHHSSSLIRSSGSGKLKKDPSLSQEELNRKVEAFIKKMNEEIRLQRLESLKQYTEMINPGGH